MGYFVCQHCGAHLHDSKVEDLYQWDDDKSIGWSFVCPKCKEENLEIVTLYNKDLKFKYRSSFFQTHKILPYNSNFYNYIFCLNL